MGHLSALHFLAVNAWMNVRRRRGTPIDVGGPYAGKRFAIKRVARLRSMHQLGLPEFAEKIGAAPRILVYVGILGRPFVVQSAESAISNEWSQWRRVGSEGTVVPGRRARGAQNR